MKVLLNSNGEFIGYSEFGIEIDYDFTTYTQGTPVEIEEAEGVACKDYLSTTDWYMARKVETGEEVPTAVVTKREEARAYIREVEDGK